MEHVPTPASPKPETDRRNTVDIVESALRTIETEADGLAQLSAALQNGLSEPFAEAIDIVRNIPGRLIVTGVGKSGHIGTKIAATLASTGTPSFFVHATEASHGDLGMIAPNGDAILALSWSGETQELASIITYSRRFRVPLLAMTSNKRSALGRAADVVFELPNATEACPHGLAPTTSTMIQMALGDALAIALLESRGFTAQDFKVFHPGGRLGASLNFVRDLMHTGDRVPLAEQGTRMSDAIVLISRKGFGCLGVTDGNGHLIGMITDGDLRRNLSNNLIELTVEQVMTRSPKTASPDWLVSAALETLNTLSITALYVVEDGEPVGIIHMHDLLRAGVA